MHKACVKAVDRLCKSLGKVSGLTTQWFVFTKYLTSQVFFVRSLSTPAEHPSGGYGQAISSIFNPLGQYLYPLSTAPITNTNLIKE
jgi:hypothetical protein